MLLSLFLLLCILFKKKQHKNGKNINVNICFVAQMISGQEFEVNRRLYVDFEGISLRRKFLTGLEPELINVMIGKHLAGFQITPCIY